MRQNRVVFTSRATAANSALHGLCHKNKCTIAAHQYNIGKHKHKMQIRRILYDNSIWIMILKFLCILYYKHNYIVTQRDPDAR
jgi:hypothetical protein